MIDKPSEQFVANNIPSHYLYPASLITSETPCIVNTILGSCVAVCIHDPVRSYGGINHFMLPTWNGKDDISPRYGDFAIAQLIDQMIAMGSQQKNLQAKIFGGAEVIDTTIASYNIGLRNIELAIERLDKYSIPIISRSVGGRFGRKIVYLTGTGKVNLKYVNRPVTEKIP